MIELPVVETGLNIGTIDLNSGKVTATNAAQITFSCTSRIECCSNLTIPVTDFDVDRILDHGYELDQIVTELSPIILPIKGTRSMTERVYALKRKPFDNTCTFLEDKKCKIHQFKPFACRVYPFSLEIEDENLVKVNIHENALCKSIRSTSLSKSDNKRILRELHELVRDELTARV